jgi:SAM-dependent methyltransferase
VYSDDLAYVHNAGFAELASRAGTELLGILRQRGIRPTRSRRPLIVEVGCGSGILASRLSAAGYDVLGIDRSPAMVRLARAQAPPARFRVASLEDARLPRASAVIAIGEIVTYVPGGLAVLQRFFHRVRRALEPGGLFIFDFIESAERRTYRRKEFQGEDWGLVSSASTNRAGRVLTRRMKLRRRIDGQVRTSAETHRISIYSRDEIAQALTAVGFRFEMCRSLGSYRLIAGDLVVIASVR